MTGFANPRHAKNSPTKGTGGQRFAPEKGARGVFGWLARVGGAVEPCPKPRRTRRGRGWFWFVFVSEGAERKKGVYIGRGCEHVSVPGPAYA